MKITMYFINENLRKDMRDNEEALTIFFFVLIAVAVILALALIIMFLRTCNLQECLDCCCCYQMSAPPMMMERGVSSSGGGMIEYAMEARENQRPSFELRTFQEYNSFDEIQICNEVPCNVTNVPPTQRVPKGILQTKVNNTLERNKRKANQKKGTSLRWRDKEVVPLLSPAFEVFPNVIIINGPQETVENIQQNISVVNLSERDQLCCISDDKSASVSKIKMSDIKHGNMARSTLPACPMSWPRCSCSSKPPAIKGYAPGLPTVYEDTNDA